MIATLLAAESYDMSDWAWFFMAAMTIGWLVVAIAAVLIAVAVTRDRERGRRS